MKQTAKEILKLHCPSMDDKYLSDNEKLFRDSICRAMMHYAELVRDDQRRIIANYLNMRNVPKSTVEHG